MIWMARMDRARLRARGGRVRGMPVFAWAVLALSILTAPLPAQDRSRPQGYPEDWSHHHLVFSNPGTYEQAVQNGTVEAWTKITNNPRYKHQQLARSRAAAASPDLATPADAAESAPAPRELHPGLGKKTAKLEKDWSTNLSGVAASLTGTVGALSGTSISGNSTLTVDGVTFDASAPTGASATGTFSTAPTSATSPTITVQSGAYAITLTTNATAKTATGTITAGSPGAPLTGQTIVIPSNAGSIALTPGGSPATMTGSVGTAFTTGTITLTYNNGGGTANTLSLTPSVATQGKVVGTFTASGGSTGQFTPGTTAGTFVVTSGSNTATLTPNGYQYFIFSGIPSFKDTATITLNGTTTTYSFASSAFSSGYVAEGSTAAEAAQNLAAAVMADSTMCATSSCFNGFTKQSNVSASYDTSGHTYIFYSGTTPTTITIGDSSSTITESLTTVTKGSNSCSGSGATIAGAFGAVATSSGGASSSAANMAAALNLCTNLGMTAASTATTVTATNTAYGATPAVSTSESMGGFSSVATQGAGSSGCSNSTTGVFPTYSGITTAIEASNISAAITACDSSYPAVGGSAVYSSGSTFTVTAAAPGSAVTLSGTSPAGFSWSAFTLGNDTGAGTCTSSTAGTFVNNGVANTIAANIYNTLISASCTTTYSSGVTATHATGNTFVVTANVLGSSPAFTATGSTATVISWGTTSGGSNGTNSCSGSGPWTATFVTSTTLSTIEAGVTAAINACTSGTTNVTATGNAVVSASVPGSGSTLTVGATNNTGIFSWSGVTPGTDGTTSGTSSPPTFAYWSGSAYVSTSQVASNIAMAINSNLALQSVTSGVSATVSGSSVIITANATGAGGNSYTVSESNFSAWSPNADLANGGAGTLARVQPNMYPAKYSSFSSSGTTTASCTDFVVYPTGTAGATNVSTIIAYTNLYSGCTSSGAVPSVYWSYNTGTGYAVTTSPVMSLDGTQVAFVQSNGTTAELVLLKWAANSSAAVGAPGATTSESTASSYHSCTAPCYYAVSLGTTDTFSSPFYFYDGDILYVGDDSGKLHQMTGVFLGNPARDPAGSVVFPDTGL